MLSAIPLLCELLIVVVGIQSDARVFRNPKYQLRDLGVVLQEERSRQGGNGGRCGECMDSDTMLDSGK